LGFSTLQAAARGLIEDAGEAAAQAAAVKRVFELNTDYRALYADLFCIYRQLYPALQKPFARLAEVSTNTR